MWMHNGGLGGWQHIKRRLGERLADRWYLSVVGGTDSEWAFALFLDTLERMGHDPSAMPDGGFGPTVLRKAVLKTIETINELIDQIPERVLHAENVDTRSLLNIAVTDGHSVICTRYVSSQTDEAASLYYSSGTQWETRPTVGDEGDYQMERRDKGADIVLVASEPLTFERGKFVIVLWFDLDFLTDSGLAENWVNVPTNSVLTIHNQTVMVHPIIDQYYQRSPYHVRSSAFVQTKGLATNEKNLPSRIATTPSMPAEIDGFKRSLTPLVPFGVSRSRTPEAPVSARGRTVITMEVPTPSDRRSVTSAPSVTRVVTSPVQGNIKKKRASPNTVDAVMVASQETLEPDSLGTLEAPRSEFGNPNKIAQFFPELRISQ
jgi:glutamine amidotransferase